MASKPWRLPSQEPPASSKAPTSTTRKLSEFLRRPSLVAWQKSSTSTDVVPAPKWQRNMSVPDIRPMQGYPAISAPMPSDAHRSQWPGPRLHPERRPSNAVDTGSEVGPTSFALPGCCPSDSLAPEFSSLNTIPPVSLIPLPCAQLPSNPRNDHQPSYDVESGFGRGTLPPPSVRLSEYQWAKVPIQSASKTQVVVSPPPSLASQLLRKASRQIGDALFALDEVADIYASEKGATEADGVDKGPRTLDELRELRDALAMLQDGFQTGSFSAIVEAQKSQRANPRSIPRKPCPDVQRTTAARKIATATGNEGTVSSSKLRSSSRDTASRSVSESSESEHYSMMSKSTRLTSQTSLTEPEIRPATASERGAKGAPGDPAVRRRPSEAAFAQGWQQGWTFNGGANGTADPLTVAKDWNMRDVDIGHKKLDHSIPVYGRSASDPTAPRIFTDTSLDARLSNQTTALTMPADQANAVRQSPWDNASSAVTSRKMSIASSERPPRPARSDTRRPSVTASAEVAIRRPSVAQGAGPMRRPSAAPPVAPDPFRRPSVATTEVSARQRSQSLTGRKLAMPERNDRSQRDFVPADVPQTPVRSPTTAELLVSPQADEMNQGIAVARHKLGMESSLTVPFFLGPHEGRKHPGSRLQTNVTGASHDDEHCCGESRCDDTRQQGEHATSKQQQQQQQSAGGAMSSDCESDLESTCSSRDCSGSRGAVPNRRRPSTIVAGQMCEVRAGSPVEALSAAKTPCERIRDVDEDHESSSRRRRHDGSNGDDRQASRGNASQRDPRPVRQDLGSPLVRFKEPRGDRPCGPVHATQCGPSRDTVATRGQIARMGHDHGRSLFADEYDAEADFADGEALVEACAGANVEVQRRAPHSGTRPLRLQGSVDHLRSRAYRPRASLIAEHDECD